MRIDFAFSGGFGGLFAAQPAGISVDTDDLPAEVAERLLELVMSSGLLESDATAATGAAGSQRDVFTYDLKITQEGETRAFRFDDTTAPASSRELLAFLRDLVMDRRKAGLRG